MPYPTISQNALLVGLCPLIPIPVVDELLRKVMMKGAYLSIGEQLGRPLDPETVEVLAEFRGNWVLGCLGAVVWWPIKKLLKTVFYVFTVKECLDWVAEAAVRGAMVRDAIARGMLPEKVEGVRRAMDLAWEAHGGSPVTRFLLRRDSPELEWGEGTALTPAVGGLARRGAAALVMKRFHEILDLVEAGTATPPALPG